MYYIIYDSKFSLEVIVLMNNSEKGLETYRDMYWISNIK